MAKKPSLRSIRLPGLAWNSNDSHIRQERTRMFESYSSKLEPFGEARRNFEVAFDHGVTLPQVTASILGEWPPPNTWTPAIVRDSIADGMPSFHRLDSGLKDTIVEIATEAARLSTIHRWQT